MKKGRILMIITLICIFLLYDIFKFKDSKEKYHIICILLDIVLGIVLITQNHNLLTIPNVMLFLSICVYILLKQESKLCKPFLISIGITVIAYIIAGIMIYQRLNL